MHSCYVRSKWGKIRILTTVYFVLKSERSEQPESWRTGRQLRTPALVARADFLKVGHFARFSHFLHIKGRNFIRSRLPKTPMNDEKFSGNRSARFLKSGRQTDTERERDRQTGQLYIYRCRNYAIVTLCIVYTWLYCTKSAPPPTRPLRGLFQDWRRMAN